MWIGAILLSVVMIPFGIEVLAGGVATLRSYHDFNVVAILSLWLVSFSLLVWCDLELGREARQVKRGPTQTIETNR